MAGERISRWRGRGPSIFRERDVRAAIRAVEATGKEIAAVEIDQEGRIRVIVGTAATPVAEAKNPWDDED